MIAQSTAPTSSEREPETNCRVFERTTCELPTVCQPASVQEMRENRWEGAIIDISRGGVRLRLVRRFERGAALAIEIPGDGVRESYSMFVKVMHVRADAGAWHLGCRFISEMSDDEVQRLLDATQHILSRPKVPKPTPDDPPEDEADAEPAVDFTPSPPSSSIVVAAQQPTRKQRLRAFFQRFINAIRRR